jgi:hypothetical protein
MKVKQLVRAKQLITTLTKIFVSTKKKTTIHTYKANDYVSVNKEYIMVNKTFILKKKEKL